MLCAVWSESPQTVGYQCRQSGRVTPATAADRDLRSRDSLGVVLGVADEPLDAAADAAAERDDAPYVGAAGELGLARHGPGEHAHRHQLRRAAQHQSALRLLALLGLVPEQ